MFLRRFRPGCGTPAEVTDSPALSAGVQQVTPTGVQRDSRHGERLWKNSWLANVFACAWMQMLK